MVLIYEQSLGGKLVSDVSLRLSQKGDDVRRARDYQQIFNSDWPVLSPIFTGRIAADLPAGTTIVEHKLGFKPFFIAWTKGNELSETTFNHTTGPLALQINRVNYYEIRVDNTKMYIGSRGSSVWPVDRYYAIFNLSLDEPFISSIVSPGKQAEQTNTMEDNFSFRVTKQGPIGVRDPKDFTVNSDFRPMLVHSVHQHTKAVGGLETITFRHDLGYAPSFFVFGKETTFDSAADGYRDFEIAPSSSTNMRVNANSSILTVTIAGPVQFSVVMLKDPVL